MLKKVVIAALAVVVGVAVLAWVSPPMFDWMVHQGKAFKDGAEDKIPLEDRIDTLKEKLKDIKNNKSKYYDQAAKVSVEVDQLTADVAKDTVKVDTQWKNVEALRTDLDDTQRTAFHYNGADWKRSEVEKQLKQDFESYKTADGALDSKKDLLTAKKAALEAARAQLANLESLNSEMEARLEQMKADLQRVRLREAQSGTKVDDNEYAGLKAEMDQVGGKIAEREKALDLHAEFDKGQINPLADKPAGGDDIKKQIDAYKAAKNGDPKPTEVAGQH
jgi:chromosome segregation ATPase